MNILLICHSSGIFQSMFIWIGHIYILLQFEEIRWGWVWIEFFFRNFDLSKYIWTNNELRQIQIYIKKTHGYIFEDLHRLTARRELIPRTISNYKHERKYEKPVFFHTIFLKRRKYRDPSGERVLRNNVNRSFRALCIIEYSISARLSERVFSILRNHKDGQGSVFVTSTVTRVNGVGMGWGDPVGKQDLLDIWMWPVCGFLCDLHKSQRSDNVGRCRCERSMWSNCCLLRGLCRSVDCKFLYNRFFFGL